MAEFSSEIGAFIQQKRDRNQRLTLENRQKLADVAGQLSQQTQQKIGWKQSAEQLNTLGSQNLTDWIPVSWTEVASRGVDPIVQDINFRVQQGQFKEFTGEQPTAEGENGKTTDLTTPQMQNRLKLDVSKDEIRSNIQAKYGDDLTGNILYEEILKKINKATNADITDVGYEVEKEIKQLENF